MGILDDPIERVRAAVRFQAEAGAAFEGLGTGRVNTAALDHFQRGIQALTAEFRATGATRVRVGASTFKASRRALENIVRAQDEQRTAQLSERGAIPDPIRRLTTTATFPAGTSAQEPILAGSRSYTQWNPATGLFDGRFQQGDPFGWIIPSIPDTEPIEAFEQAADTLGALARAELHRAARAILAESIQRLDARGTATARA